MSGHYFHFTLGPVQSFVAQARRTRDFWAGSFLLSYLAGVAMCATQIQGAKIVFPVPNDDFLNAIQGQGTALPKQGGIPNRFMADIGACENFNANAVVNAVKQAWLAISEKVWQHDEKGLNQNPQSQIIWKRQTEQFWDMSWVMTADKEPSALDKRKNFRTHTLPSEDGYKCMMMEGFQELSGASDKNSGKKRRAYWQHLAYAIRSKDIGENEELCAIAYIKRRFVHIFADVKKEIDVNGKTLTIHGWKLPHNVPSVAYMASSTWLKSLLTHSDELVLKNFEHFLSCIDEMEYMTKIGVTQKSEIRNHILSIENLVKKVTLSKGDISLDGNVYYQTYWDNINNFVDDKQNYDGRIDDHRPKAKSALIELCKSMDNEPSPYYAILLMDGDSLGKQMSVEARQPVISQALDDFTNQAQTIVRENDGFLIYAGGDDVLALFSLDDAMRSAYLLQQAYKECFKNAVNKVKDKSPNAEKVYSTLSGAINYCHIGTPLTQVLMDSHQLLDDVAKDGTGRNALAVRVHKPSGQAVQWSLPWDKVMGTKHDSEMHSKISLLKDKLRLENSDNIPVIEALALAMNQQKTDDKNVSIFSTGFFYQMRDLMRTLNKGDWKKDEQASKLLLAEYLQSGNFRKIDDKQQQELIAIFDILLDQSRDYRSKIDDGKADIDKESGKKLTGDAGILLRILGQKGLGKGDK